MIKDRNSPQSRIQAIIEYIINLVGLSMALVDNSNTNRLMTLSQKESDFLVVLK
jgi:hypothetical protein